MSLTLGLAWELSKFLSFDNGFCILASETECLKPLSKHILSSVTQIWTFFNMFITCELGRFVQVFMVIPPKLSDPCNFIIVIVTGYCYSASIVVIQKLEQRMIAWRLTPFHSQPMIARALQIQFQISFLPLHFDSLLFVYLLLFMHQAIVNKNLASANV